MWSRKCIKCKKEITDIKNDISVEEIEFNGDDWVSDGYSKSMCIFCYEKEMRDYKKFSFVVYDVKYENYNILGIAKDNILYADVDIHKMCSKLNNYPIIEIQKYHLIRETLAKKLEKKLGSGNEKII